MSIVNLLTEKEKLSLRKFLYKIINEIDSVDKKIKNIDKEIFKELDSAAIDAIDDFYYDYDRDEDSYNPKGSLYEMYRIVEEDDDWKIEYSHTFTNKKHRVSNEYIFENSFVQGYHGGADDAKVFKGDPHPKPGIPYYKVPPAFTSWLRPASQSESPKLKIEEESRRIIKKYDNKYIESVKNLSNMNKGFEKWIKVLKSKM